jgi:hypothetical protein
METDQNINKKKILPGDNLDRYYDIILNEYNHTNNLLWQSPLISFTGQAFLFSISLGANISFLSRIISSSLGIVLSISSIQLFRKHRRIVITRSQQLEKIEHLYTFPEIIHKKNNFENCFGIEKISSYKFWLVTLIFFALMNVLVLSILFFNPVWIMGNAIENSHHFLNFI